MSQKRFYRQAQVLKTVPNKILYLLKRQTPPRPTAQQTRSDTSWEFLCNIKKASLLFFLTFVILIFGCHLEISPSTPRLLSTPSPEGGSIAASTTRVFDSVHGLAASCTRCTWCTKNKMKKAGWLFFLVSHLQPTGLNVAILPVITKDLPIFPRFTPYDF